MDTGTPEVPADMRPSVFLQQHGSARDIFTAMGMQRTRKSKGNKGEELKRAQMYAKVKKLRESSDYVAKQPKETRRRQLQKYISKLDNKLKNLGKGQQNQEECSKLEKKLNNLKREFRLEKKLNSKR